jgi:hypothetical protein
MWRAYFSPILTPTRRCATNLKNSFDLFLDPKKNIARVSGFESLPQVVQQTLSTKRGESPFHPNFGSRIGKYFEADHNTQMLVKFIKLDAIRLAAIPYQDETGNRAYTVG